MSNTYGLLRADRDDVFRLRNEVKEAVLIKYPHLSGLHLPDRMLLKIVINNALGLEDLNGI